MERARKSFYNWQDKRVAILIPIYNGSKFLRETLASVISQDSHYFEVFICDDGSDDGSSLILKDYIAMSDRKVTLISHETNLGVTQSIIDLCKAASENCDVAILLAQDDVIPINFVSLVHSYFQLDNRIVLTFSAILMDENSSRIGVAFAAPRIQYLGRFKSALLLASNVVNACGVAFGLDNFKTEYLGRDNPLTQDWNQWLYLSLEYRFISSPHTNVFYRIHNDNISHTGNLTLAHKEIHQTRMCFVKSNEFKRFTAEWSYPMKYTYFFFTKLLFFQFPLCLHNYEFLELLAITLGIKIKKRRKLLIEACGIDANRRMINARRRMGFESTSNGRRVDRMYINWLRITLSSLRLLLGRAFYIVVRYPIRSIQRCKLIRISSTGGLATQLMTLSYVVWLRKYQTRDALISFIDRGTSYFPLVVQDLLSNFTFRIIRTKDSTSSGKGSQVTLKANRDRIIGIHSAVRSKIKLGAKKTLLVVSDDYLGKESLGKIKKYTFRMGGYNADWRIVVESWKELSELIDESKRDNFIRDAGFEDTISIHWRIGDYLSNTVVNSTHGVVTAESILKCMDKIRESTQIQRVNIFSDSPQVAKKLLGDSLQSYEVLFIERNAWDSLYLMTRSRVFIGTNSGISGWAATSISQANPDALVFLPDRWFKNPPTGFDSELVQGVHPADASQTIKTYLCHFL